MVAHFIFPSFFFQKLLPTGMLPGSLLFQNILLRVLFPVVILLGIALFTPHWASYEGYNMGLLTHCKNHKCVSIHDNTFLVLDQNVKSATLSCAILISIAIVCLLLKKKVYIILSFIASLLAICIYYNSVYKYKYFPYKLTLGYSFYLAVFACAFTLLMLFLKEEWALLL
jgi:hypothetical protein